MTTETLPAADTTEVGSYFIANYPPFSQWKPEHLPEFLAALDAPAQATAQPLGLYLHIPFCRKRCKFCYFRVYTDQNAKAIERYAQAIAREVELLSERPAVANRTLKFVYFGGGTPSYLSARQLHSLRDRLHRSVSWDHAEEVTFECEPGTLSLEKVKTLKDIGITRVSLGVENFNDEILESNGRAHLSAEIMRAYDWIQSVGFPQVNVDLIAGMVGETDANWAQCVERVRAMSPDNITIYQMELPHNTLIAREMKERHAASPVASWAVKRRWVSEAFDTLAAAGYHISSAQELVKNPQRDHFIYRDSVWRGADLLATGVASFGHLSGVHYQNVDQLEDYLSALELGQLPLGRALVPTPHQLLIREMTLQLKEGRISAKTFLEKFGVNVIDEFADAFRRQEAAGFLVVEADEVRLTRKGLLQVDTLLPEFFEPAHRAVRYT
ncbi:MAG TPA: coproporphyrinogen-III oxidase family protein [Planctomycetaceae bacterium]|nr:coproporphyrinogen-III oxidase family protein [Planctomycetaceae bacterium]